MKRFIALLMAAIMVLSMAACGSKKAQETEVAAQTVAGSMEELLNKTIWRHHEHRKDLEHWFVLKYAAFKENATFIGRSLSFGLVLFGLGLCATLVYLLIFALL